jgi:hypothetical protein
MPAALLRNEVAAGGVWAGAGKETDPATAITRGDNLRMV